MGRPVMIARAKHFDSQTSATWQLLISDSVSFGCPNRTVCQSLPAESSAYSRNSKWMYCIFFVCVCVFLLFLMQYMLTIYIYIYICISTIYDPYLRFWRIF